MVRYNQLESMQAYDIIPVPELDTVCKCSMCSKILTDDTDHELEMCNDCWEEFKEIEQYTKERILR